MGLRAQAVADLQAITEDATAGFGWPIRITPPTGATAEVVGFANDIHMTIDPDTGVAVSGRSVSIAVALASLEAAGLGIPKGIADKASKPWVVAFEDHEAVTHTFKVQEALPDRAAGIVVCLLEGYTPASVDS